MCFEDIGSKSRTSVCSQATVSTDLEGNDTFLLVYLAFSFYWYSSIYDYIRYRWIPSVHISSKYLKDWDYSLFQVVVGNITLIHYGEV